LAAITTGSLAYRMGRVGWMGLGSGNAVRALSVVGVLRAEVSAFELTNRGLTSVSVGAHGRAPLHANLWHWSGQGGLQQGLLQSLITFGTLKGVGHLARGENVMVQHLLQDTAMVFGHRAAGAVGAGPRPTGTLAEQFLHAEATTLQLAAGMTLAHRVTPGIHGIERGLDQALSPLPPEPGSPTGQPVQYFDGETPLPTPQPAFGGIAPSRRLGTTSFSGDAPQNHILMSVKHEGERAIESEGGAGNSGIHVRSPRVREFSVQSFVAPNETTFPSEPKQGKDATPESPT